MVGVISPPLPLSTDMLFRLSLTASVTTPVNMSALVSRRPNSVPYVINNAIGPVAHSGNRTRETFTEPTGGGFLWRLGTGTPGGVKRGQMYGEIGLEWRGGGGLSIGSGYISQMSGLKTGFFEGSRTGPGHLQWRTVADDIAPADITEPLAVANAFRRVFGYVWYYHCSGDVADRGLQASIRAPGPSIPTGFSIVERIVDSTQLTLSANQEGIVYSYKSRGGDGAGITNDNGTVANTTTSTFQQIWPLEVSEEDLIEIFFNVTNEEAADRHSIFILQEEWIEL